MKKFLLGALTLTLALPLILYAALSDSAAMARAKALWGNQARIAQIRGPLDTYWTKQIGYASPFGFVPIGVGENTWDAAFATIPTPNPPIPPQNVPPFRLTLEGEDMTHTEGSLIDLGYTRAWQMTTNAPITTSTLIPADGLYWVRMIASGVSLDNVGPLYSLKIDDVVRSSWGFPWGGAQFAGAFVAFDTQLQLTQGTRKIDIEFTNMGTNGTITRAIIIDKILIDQIQNPSFETRDLYIMQRVWARPDTAAIQNFKSKQQTSGASQQVLDQQVGAFVHLGAQDRFMKALAQVRASNPATFDGIMSSNGLAVDLLH